MHPREFGRYRILKLLPLGGMGRVYLAEDATAGDRIALKLIDQAPGPEYGEIVEAERRGARLQESLCRLDPRVADVLGYGELNGFFYIEMEYVEGHDLAEVLAKGPLGVPFAARIGRDLCQTLSVAHTFEEVVDGHRFSGIVHGDIKPRNIRITPDGQVRVLDFGIAKALSATRQFTENRFGSSQYSSPERLQTGDVDTASDLWSVGVVLFEIVVGRPYFEGDSGARLENEIRNYRQFRPFPPHLPAGFAAILRKALHPDAVHRYATAEEFAADLDAFLNGRPSLAETAPPPDPDDDDPERTRRSTRPEDDDPEATRRTAGPPIPAGYRAVTPKPPKVRRPLTPRERQAALVAGGLALVFALWFCWNEMAVYRGGAALVRELETDQLTDMDAAWKRYESLAARNYMPLVLWNTRRIVKNRMIASADRTIAEYRSESPSVSESDWIRAQTVLSKALELDPGDDEIRGKRYLSEGHISRIRGTARANGKLLTDARQKFEQARDLMSKSPDPYLGLARLYVYALKDVDKAEDALKAASKRGHEIGRREKAQLGDGYRDRAERLLREADRVTGLPEEKDYLERAREDFQKADGFYREIVPFGGSANSLRRVLEFLEHVDVRLRIVREGA